MAFVEGANGQPRVEEISELLAVRIRNFGGALNNFIPGATLHNQRLRLVAFKTRSFLRCFHFQIPALLGRSRSTREIEMFDVVSVECRPCNGSLARIFVEADGEILGHLPVRIEIVPHAITLSKPPSAKP